MMREAGDAEAVLGPDRHPGAPRILFVGLGESTHTRSWVELLEDTHFNVRLFALPSGMPPAAWPVPTYVSVPHAVEPLPRLRFQPVGVRATPEGRVRRIATRLLRRPRAHEVVEDWLAEALQRWRPDVIHSFGIGGASELVLRALSRPDVPRPRAWVVQARGGPDLALHRLLPEHVPGLRAVLGACDELVADNAQNYAYAVELGLDPARRSSLGVVPGTGGVDVDDLAARGALPPSRRERLIVWPKAYECPQSKALPVLDALALAWPELAPCRVIGLASIPEVRMWRRTLPGEIQAAFQIEDRIPRDEVLELMTRARVMLAPSLSDGIPNSLYEAMAAGAFPIVSPIETLTGVVQEERQVLFARNLRPDEIAGVLVRAMRDDGLVDGAFAANRAWVREHGDRKTIGPRVAQRYAELAGRTCGEEPA